MREHTLATIRVAFKRHKRGLAPKDLVRYFEDWLHKQRQEKGLSDDDITAINVIIKALKNWPDDTKEVV